MPEPALSELFGTWREFGPKPLTHREVTRYLRDLRAGGPRDPDLDARIDHEIGRPMADPLKPEPPEPTEPAETDPAEIAREQLLRLLLCTECHATVSAAPCGPLHALLQDSPLQHPLLLPLMESVVTSIRTTETKICPVCQVAIAQGSCKHIVDRWGQVWMSSEVWHDLEESHGELAEEFGDLKATHDAFVEIVDEERREARRRRAESADGAIVIFDGLLHDAAWRMSRPAPSWADELRRRFRDEL